MAFPACQARTILRSIEIVEAPKPYTTIPHGTLRPHALDKILPVPYALAFHGAIRQLPRTKLYTPLQVKLVWSDGTTQTLALVYRGISGMKRDVLFTDCPRMPLVVKLQDDSIFGLLRDGRWSPNEDEMDVAHALHDLIPKVYGLWNLRIGYTHCSALVLQKVSSTVPAFFKDLMRRPLPADLLLGALDVLINILKQMCAYAGPEHQFRLDDWHAHYLGIEQKHVYLLDWVAIEYRPELSDYQRIKRAMKSFLRIPTYQASWFQFLKGYIPGESLSLLASRTDWMRVLGQIWQYLGGMWWPRFHGKKLPTTEQLDDLTTELTVKLTTFPIWMCNRLFLHHPLAPLQVDGEDSNSNSGAEDADVEAVPSATRERRPREQRASYEARTKGARVENVKGDKKVRAKRARGEKAEKDANAKLQRALEGNEWRRRHMADLLGYCLRERYENHHRALEEIEWRRCHTADSLGYCALRVRHENHQWVKGHGPPRHTRRVLDQASLLLRCLHAHLHKVGMDRFLEIPPWSRQGLKLPWSARPEGDYVNEHWVRKHGARLLDAFDEAQVDISTAYVTDIAAVLKSWLWKKVSTDGQKRFLTPPPGFKRCRSELGWPNFSISYDEFRVVIGKTMSDYSMASYIGYWETSDSDRA